MCLYASTGPYTHVGQETALGVIPQVQTLFSVRQQLSFPWHLLASQQILGNLPVFIPPALITSMYHHAFFFFFGMDSGDLTQVLMIALLQTGQSSWLW